MNSLLCFYLWLYLWPYNLMTDSYSKLFLFNLSIKLFVLFSMKPPGFKLPFCWKYKVILRYGDPIDTGATVVKKFRRHSCWSHRDVVDGIPSWRHLLNISVWRLFLTIMWILVTIMIKTVNNISKLSPTHFVSNIRHQHRCGPSQISNKTKMFSFLRCESDIRWSAIIVNDRLLTRSLSQNFLWTRRITCPGLN